MNAKPFALYGLVLLALPSMANGQRSEARAQARALAARSRADLRDAQEAARELKLAMERGRFVPAMAIIRKYTGDKDDSTVELQLMQSAAGMSKTTIMAPL